MDEWTVFFFKMISGAAVGAIMGSFISMLAYRLPRRLSIITPRSFCNICKKTLVMRDLVPMVSYFLNKGHCRFCGRAYGWHATALEVFCAACGAGIAITVF